MSLSVDAPRTSSATQSAWPCSFAQSRAVLSSCMTEHGRRDLVRRVRHENMHLEKVKNIKTVQKPSASSSSDGIVIHVFRTTSRSRSCDAKGFGVRQGSHWSQPLPKIGKRWTSCDSHPTDTDPCGIGRGYRVLTDGYDHAIQPRTFDTTDPTQLSVPCERKNEQERQYACRRPCHRVHDIDNTLPPLHHRMPVDTYRVLEVEAGSSLDEEIHTLHVTIESSQDKSCVATLCTRHGTSESSSTHMSSRHKAKSHAAHPMRTSRLLRTR